MERRLQIKPQKLQYSNFRIYSVPPQVSEHKSFMTPGECATFLHKKVLYNRIDPNFLFFCDLFEGKRRRVKDHNDLRKEDR